MGMVYILTWYICLHEGYVCLHGKTHRIHGIFAYMNGSCFMGSMQILCRYSIHGYFFTCLPGGFMLDFSWWIC